MLRLAPILALFGQAAWSLIRGRRPRLDRGMAREVRAARHTGARGNGAQLNRQLADLERRREAARNAK